jgi:iron complex outermembrane receptor protein
MGTQLRSIKNASLFFLTSLLGAFIAGPVLAADQDPDGSSDEMVLEEVIVTARKREESLQEFAGAITAISGDMFSENVINHMQDLRNMVPNLYLDEDLGGQSTVKIFIRGIGIDNPAVSFDSPVGIYIDGVYHARAFGSLTDLYDIERIEFLRGPQGTLYGRNNSAGAMRVMTNKPVLDKVEAGASVGYGTESQVNLRGFWNMPLVEDSVGLRLSFTSNSNDGFMTETITGKRFKFDDRITGRGALRFVPNDRWEINWRADFVKDDGTGSLASSIAPQFNTDDDIYTATLNITPDNSLDVWGTSLDLFRQGNNIDFVSITGYRAIDMANLNGDADGAPLSMLEGITQTLDQFQFTEEAYFTSSSEIGGRGLDWTAGIFYLHEETEVEQQFDIFTFVGRPSGDTQFFDQDIDSFAGYGEADLAVTDRFTLTGGLRYSDESKDVTVESFSPDGSFNFDFADTYSTNKWTWKAGLDFAVTDDFFLYALAGTGFRSGGIGINPQAKDVEAIKGDIFDPEEALSYEAGFKSTFFGGAVTFNADYYYVDYTSLQLAVLGTDGIVVNTPDATVHGIEMELSAMLTDGLTLNANLGTQKDDIKDSDLELKNTPDWQGRIGLVYTTALPGERGGITLSGDVSYTDDYFASTANTILVDGYTMVNAMARWDSSGGHWGLSISGRNLTDEYYPIHGFKIVPGLLDNEFPNYPRRWLAEVHFYY